MIWPSRPEGHAPRRAAGHSIRGALPLIAAMLTLAGAIRLGIGVSQAMVANPPAEAAAQTPDSCDGAGSRDDPALMPLIEALHAREARVAAGEARLDDREQALALTDAAVTRKLAALRAAEKKLSATLAIADTAAEADIERLTAVYESMRPKDAAAVFEAMEPDFAAGFMGRMKPAAAAAVLAGMTPEKAYAVSVILAGRNAAAPKR